MSSANPYESITVPNGWTCKRLEECTQDGTISYGIVQPGQHTENGVPVIRINNINNGQLELKDVLRVSHEIEKKYERTRLKGGEVLLTLVGSTGQSFVAPKELAGWNVPRAIAVIRADKTIGADWINICLQTEEVKHFLNVRANTTVQKTLNLKDVRDIPILIPPKDVKSSIESIALGISQKIHLNTQTNQTLESIAQAIFKSWFVDFEPVKAKMAVLADGGTREQAELAAMGAISGKSEAELAQLQQQNPEHYQQLAETAALFPSAMVESELGGIPEGWGVGSIGDIALAKGGYAFKSNEFEATGNKVVKIKNITGDGRVDLTDCDCVKHPQPEKLDRFKITNGDLLMAMTGATVGKIGIAVSGNDYVYLNQRVAKFESKIKTKKVSWFLFPCIQQKSIFDTIVGSAQGSAQPNISSTEIERTEIVVPDENLISKYCDLVDPFFKKWMANNILNTELANLRDSLLPKLLSGEIDLSDIQSEVA